MTFMFKMKWQEIMNIRLTRNFGFTLIELLVVISIISLLSSVIMANLNTTRARSRDAVRLSDLRQIRIALENYRSSNTSYPDCANAYINGTTDCLSIALIAAGTMSKLPVDPKFAGGGNSSDYQYYSTAGGGSYALRSTLETNIVSQNSNYPNGTTCVTAGLPTCGWYSSCVYRGYAPSSCGLSISFGSE